MLKFTEIVDRVRKSFHSQLIHIDFDIFLKEVHTFEKLFSELVLQLRILIIDLAQKHDKRVVKRSLHSTGRSYKLSCCS